MTSYIPSPRVAVAPPDATAQRRTMRVTAFSCRGLEALSRELGFRVAVVAAVTDPDRHRERLRELWYASGLPMSQDEWPLPFDFDNWDYRAWSKLEIDSRWFGGTPHPLAGSVDDGDLLLRLPDGAAPRAVSEAFRDGLAPLRFEAVARRPANLVRRHHGCRPVAVASRYARASGESMTAVEVRDLIWFVPRTFRRVADMAVSALLASAGGVAHGAPAAGVTKPAAP